MSIFTIHTADKNNKPMTNCANPSTCRVKEC